MITGTTRLYAVVGDPVEQVQAPAMLNELFARVQADAVLVPVRASARDLAAVMAGLMRIGNLDGILVTVPHKLEVCRLADELSPAAELAGAANALRRDGAGRWLADNFDGVGFVRGLESAGHSPRGKRVSLVGAGGAGAAIAVALLAAGVAHLHVCDRAPGRLTSLLDRAGRRWPGLVSGGDSPRLAGVDIAVNATPLGLRPDDPLPFQPASLPPGCLVAEIIMKPAETSLLATAAASGFPVHRGRHMLHEQLGCYVDFFGLPALR